MPIKTYTEEFKRDAVALYENSNGTSIQKRSSPREWCICPFDKTSSMMTSGTITS